MNALLADVIFTPAASFHGNFSVNTSISDGVAAAITDSKSFTANVVEPVFLFSTPGNDILIGTSSDNDTISYANAHAGVKVSLAITVRQNTTGAGRDTLTSIENIIGSKYNDTLKGNSKTNILNGGAGNDKLNGGPEADILIGGLGADTLVGGAGTDTFLYTAINQSTAGTTNRDSIANFVSGLDKIDLSVIDANTSVAGDQAFIFIGNAAFTVAGQVRYSGGLLQANVGGANGNGADFSITLTGAPVFVATDMIA